MANVCNQCGKALPDDSKSDKCSLCAVGLVPPATQNQDNDPQSHTVVDGRTLSEIECPACGAELTRADLSRRSCSICGAFISTERLQQLQLDAELKYSTDPLSSVTQVTAMGKGGKTWPDDAPIW